jgi:hypothetical protein
VIELIAKLASSAILSAFAAASLLLTVPVAESDEAVLEDKRTKAEGTEGAGDEPNAGSITTKAPKIKGIDEVVLLINKSLERLGRRSTIIYWTILTTLIVGVFIIIFAGYLSSFDTTFSNIATRLAADRDAVQRSSAFSGETDRSYTLKRLEQIDSSYSELMKVMMAQIANRAEDKPVWNWPSTILRVGVIGLLVFLTQILISLYRYNSRLIVFYASRRDSLLLSGGERKATEEYVRIFYPANLDFGREPRHPFQELSSLFQKTRRQEKSKTDAKAE